MDPAQPGRGASDCIDAAAWIVQRGPRMGCSHPIWGAGARDGRKRVPPEFGLFVSERALYDAQGDHCDRH
eukprot:8130258-Lingulodinium_polyedra.AAC.1